MKTIFITVFEGVEAKNILRTDILPTLLGARDIRLVLLTKNQEKIDFYKKEFNDPRLIYEAAPYSRSMGKGFDRLFALLKFTLLRTKTTNLQRKLAHEAGGSFFKYYFGHLSNFLLARSFIRKAARFLDFLLVRNNIYAAIFEKYKPDLVFLAHLFEEPEIHILREAKKRGIRTIGFINSWDKTTARCAMRLLPEKFVTFNDIVKKELIAYHDVKEKNIFVGGLPQYDYYFDKRASAREEFFKKIKADSSKKLIVYAPIGSFFSVSDWDVIDLLHDLKSKGKFGKDAEMLVRFQPNDFIDEAELKKRQNLFFDCPGKRFSANRGVDWDMDQAELNHLKDTLYHMSLLICYASSISIDAAMLDKPVINIDFELAKSEPLKSPTRFYKMEHYRNALSAGGIRLVGSESELIKWTNHYLTNPQLDQEGRRRLVLEQCKFLDGKSGERIGKFILANL